MSESAVANHAGSSKDDLQTAVVVGGASGIGAAVSAKLASRGINVLIADVQEEQGRKYAEELKNKYQVDVAFQKTDVSNEQDVETMIKVVVEKWGRLDYAANVAGISHAESQTETGVTTALVDRYVRLPKPVKLMSRVLSLNPSLL